MIRLFAGFDPNEAAGYATFCHSVLTRSSEPVSITPIARNTFSWWKRKGDDDGATEFSFARFLIPFLTGYRGHAIFMDGADMLCLGDIAELWAMRSHRHSVQCVQHEPYDILPEKMWHQANRQYPKKNWSSVMILNCEYNHAHKLTPEIVASAPGSYLHQFDWAEEGRIGALPKEWNCLVGHQNQDNAKILHYTNGLPDVHHSNTNADKLWYEERVRMNHVTEL